MRRHIARPDKAGCNGLFVAKNIAMRSIVTFLSRCFRARSAPKNLLQLHSSSMCQLAALLPPIVARLDKERDYDSIMEYRPGLGDVRNASISCETEFARVRSYCARVIPRVTRASSPPLIFRTFIYHDIGCEIIHAKSSCRSLCSFATFHSAEGSFKLSSGSVHSTTGLINLVGNCSCSRPF